MALLTLITEQHAVDTEGNHWVLNHIDPPVWIRSQRWDDEVLDESQE